MQKNKRSIYRLSVSLFCLIRTKFCFRLLRSVEDLNQKEAGWGKRRRFVAQGWFGLYFSVAEEIAHCRSFRFGELRIQGVSQDDLDVWLVSGQAQDLRLFSS